MLLKAAENCEPHFSSKSLRIEYEIEKCRKMLDFSLSDSILISSYLIYTNILAPEERNLIFAKLCSKIAEFNIKIMDNENIKKHLVEIMEMLAFNKGIEKSKLSMWALDSGFSQDLIMEIIFGIIYSENPVILVDENGIFSEICEDLFGKYENIYKIYGSKISNLELFENKIMTKNTIFLYDIFTHGLVYNSEIILQKIQENTISGRIIIFITTPLNLAYIPSNFTVLNCKNEHTNLNTFKITEIMYKNILPEIYEKWLVSINEWKNFILSEQKVENQIETKLTKINETEDYTLKLMMQILDEYGENLENSAVILSKCKNILNEHQLLNTYSTALAIVFFII